MSHFQDARQSEFKDKEKMSVKEKYNCRDTVEVGGI